MRDLNGVEARHTRPYTYIQLLEYPIPLSVRPSVRHAKGVTFFEPEGPIDRGAAKF